AGGGNGSRCRRETCGWCEPRPEHRHSDHGSCRVEMHRASQRTENFENRPTRSRRYQRGVNKPTVRSLHSYTVCRFAPTIYATRRGQQTMSANKEGCADYVGVYVVMFECRLDPKCRRFQTFD